MHQTRNSTDPSSRLLFFEDSIPLFLVQSGGREILHPGKAIQKELVCHSLAGSI